MPGDQSTSPTPAPWVFVKTLLVTGAFWLITLGLLPLAITRLQHRVGLEHFFFTAPRLLGWIPIVLGTLLAIWSIVTFVIVGRGTPMAFDAPRHLVITGPYAWMRNPMVAGFLMQGIGVGLLAGSYVLILVYVLLGLWWDLWVRPLDEDMLQKRFGRDLERYRRHVPCWVPRTRRWAPPPPTAPISVEELPAPGRNRRAS